jgi:hypothetical protein
MVPETKRQDFVEEKRRYQSAVGVHNAGNAAIYCFCRLGSQSFRVKSERPRHEGSQADISITYLRGTIDLELTFSGDLSGLTGYTDAGWAEDVDARKYTNGYVFHIGSRMISWSAKRQLAVALSPARPSIWDKLKLSRRPFG